MIKKELFFGKIQLKLLFINFNENNIDNNVKEYVVRKFFSVYMLSKGDFFGVGEDLKKIFIILVGRVSELEVDRNFIVWFKVFKRLRENEVYFIFIYFIVSF